jgi:hypothetical protein
LSDQINVVEIGAVREQQNGVARCHGSHAMETLNAQKSQLAVGLTVVTSLNEQRRAFAGERRSLRAGLLSIMRVNLCERRFA